MTHLRILQRRLRQIQANHGALVALACLPSLLWRMYRGMPSPTRWPDPTGVAFDAKYGVTTCGITPIAELAVDTPNWVYGLDYQAVEVFDIGALLADLKIDYSNTVFVDLGAGKGRVLMFASVLPFKRLVGVEISAELVHAARENLTIFARASGDGRTREIVHGDAAGFVMPHEPLVVFMYNPFTMPVMSAVIKNLAGAAAAWPRRIIVVYFRPALADMWTFAPGFREVRAGPRFRIYEHDPVRRAG